MEERMSVVPCVRHGGNPRSPEAGHSEREGAMTHFGKRFREWDRVLGLLTAIGLLVVAIAGVFLSLSLPSDDAAATRSTGPSARESAPAGIGRRGIPRTQRRRPGVIERSGVRDAPAPS